VKVPFLDLRRRVEALRPELEQATARVLDGGRFVGGTPVEEFEQAWAAYCGARHAVGVASGTDALTIALLAAGVEAGDEVITAANTCVPTVAAIERAGGRPVLVDVDYATRTLDPARVEEAVTKRTRAIVPVHLYGRRADVEALHSFGLRVVEDAAQAHGLRGVTGDAAAFSFYPTKNLGALGDAGALVTDDDALAERARLLRNYGEDERYFSVVPGLNSRLDPLQAAVLLALLPRLDAWNRRRRALAALYDGALAGTVGVPEPAADHVYHLYAAAVPDRGEFRERLARAGVETLVHYPRAVHQHPAYARLDRPGRLEASERLAREVVSLPLYPELTDAEAEAVVEAAR
jgi:dTDP-4-amino-4,6-dideoxygalactose transaminase